MKFSWFRKSHNEIKYVKHDLCVENNETQIFTLTPGIFSLISYVIIIYHYSKKPPTCQNDINFFYIFT